MQESDSDRRLAAIVAVDMAGYSRRAEADQAAAVDAVAALSAVIGQAAARHAGRVFNTAGDGFMLEFPTASGALEAAADLCARAPVPVRIGVHLGDVHVTPGGDLLGHGVNVAARLQALAAPGAILVSDDVRRAARGPLADQLKPQGSARLDKMRETARIWALRLPGDAGGAAVRRSRQPLAWGLAGAGAVALAGVLGLLAMRAAAPASTEFKTAVQDFRVQGAGVDPQIGAAIADSVAAGLSARNAPTVSRDLVRRGDTGGARLLVGGEIARDGANLRVHAHIDDARAGLILWSADFERPSDQADALQDTTATKIADLIDLVRQDAAAQQAALTPDSLAALIRAEDVSRLLFDQNMDEKRAAWRRVIALAPRFANGHAALAFNDMIATYRAPPQIRAQLRAEAQAEIQTALKLDPNDGAAYVAAALLPDQDDAAGRETWLKRGLTVDPNNSTLSNVESDLAGGMGRVSEALTLHQKALEGDPLSRSKTLGVVFALMGVGRYAEARALNDRARRMWADYRTAQVAELTLDLIYGDPADGERALAAAGRGELPLTGKAIAAWRQVLAARAGKAAAQDAGRALAKAALEDGQMDLGLEASGLSGIGQTDLAFAELDRRLPARPPFFFNTLFQPGLEALRRSPGFMPFAARYGLTRYWLATGRWPDFCAAQDLPYACPAAARAVTPR